MTAERLRELLHYDPSTGVFTWKVQLSTAAPVGSRAGTIYKNGRRYIAIARRRFFASRLAWLYVRGEWPTAQIDHRNLDRSDDRLENLRQASSRQNAQNKSLLSTNKLRVKGVGVGSWRKRAPQRYRARIRVNGTLIHLGYFSTTSEASAAYAEAAVKHFGEFARTA